MDVRQNIHCCCKDMKNTIAKILIVVGIFSAITVVGRSVLYSPNDEDVKDSGLNLGLANQPGEQAPGEPVAGSSAVLPARLIIPKLDIDTDVQHVGVTRSGNMAAPNNFTDVSWWKYGTLPGNRGSAVMAGHEDNALSLDGVFKHLGDLELGDEVYVADKDGKRLRFEVVDEEIYPYNNAPLQRIFHADDDRYLVLITCAGDWLPEAKTNDQRLVIYAKLVES